jgi:hypothetical protein
MIFVANWLAWDSAIPDCGGVRVIADHRARRPLRCQERGTVHLFRHSEPSTMLDAREMGPRSDSDENLRAFGAAVARYGRDESALEHLRVPLRDFCVQARHDRMPPEQMLTRVKRVLDAMGLAEPDTLTVVNDRSPRSAIISYAIKMYYANDD